MINAVCLFYLKKFKNGEKFVLAVSRKDDCDDYGLPGGKVELGEAPEEAIVRECIEETGYRPVGVRVVFVTQNYGYLVATYVCDHLEKELEVAEEKGVVAWISESRLLKGSYAAYNKKLIKYLRDTKWTMKKKCGTGMVA